VNIVFSAGFSDRRRVNVEPTAERKLTPMMQQYMAVKERHADAIVMFRLGDFYEMFFDDARTASRVLGLTLTSRDKSEDAIPMAGVPHHAAQGYISRLTDEGFKVAVCEQVEDAGKKGLFRREVSRVVTPGMVLDDESLDQKSENLLVALSAGHASYGLAALDISTGRFRVTENASATLIGEELVRWKPREIIWTKNAALEPFVARVVKARLSERVTPPAPTLADAAAAMAVASLAEALPELPKHVQAAEPYALETFVGLDETSRRNLEIFSTLIGGKREGSLLQHLDRTQTGMGARLLSAWIGMPLRSAEQIGERQALVAHFVTHHTLSASSREKLRELYDLERLNGRLGALQSTPRDLGALRDTLGRLPALCAALTQASGDLFTEPPERLVALCATLTGFEDVHRALAEALVDTPPVTYKEGGVFRRGFDAEIDELTDLSAQGKDFLLALEAKERERTKISTLKIRYNRVFGYAIEVSRSHLGKIPENYVRKQTLANAERFVTEELKQYEEKVLHAEERRLALEELRFIELRARLVAHCGRFKQAAQALAELDVLLALAEVSVEGDYTRPELTSDPSSELVSARHPVVEAFVRARGEAYVPFDVTLGGDARLLIITGPNMAGKSTVLRAVALIHILAQIGCFVPAKRARIGLCDRIFTRVGASDNVSQGQSTFMVEMAETALILNGAGERSLVVVDEIGRGTSTTDGLSLAWAVAEDLHDRCRSRTLFATHYHDLVELPGELRHAKNFHMAVKEFRGQVVFLRELRAGGTKSSYGIEVARLAGLPASVIARAKTLLAELERERHHQAQRAEPSAQLQLFVPNTGGGVVRRLREIDIDALSPRDALNLLAELVATAKS
jgi:DNA mismatch repair protein MutS